MNSIFWKFAIIVLVSLVAFSWGTRERGSTRYTVPLSNELVLMHPSVGHPPHELFLVGDFL